MKKQLLFAIFALLFAPAFTMLAQGPACGTLFTDPAGPNTNYANDTDYTVTIYPNNPGEFVTVTFLTFDVEASWDALYVFNGNSTTAPQIASSNPAGNVPGGLAGGFWGTTNPGPFTSTSPDGSLTFHFISDSVINKAGWIANVFCNTNSTCTTPFNAIVTNTTQTTAVLGWTDQNNSLSWEVIALPCGTAPTATSVGTIVTVNPFTITNLQPETCYSFYIKSLCSATDSSAWSAPTIATTTSLPPPTPVCGGQFVDNGGATANYANGSDNTYTICPENPGDLVTVTFTAFNVETNFDGLYVFNGPSTASTQISSSNAAGSIPGGIPGAFWGSTIPGPFTSSDPSGCLTFRFRSDGSVSQAGWVANVDCGPPPTCPKPTAITVLSTNINSATIGWNETGSATQWEVIVLPAGSPLPTATSTGEITSLNPFTVSGLTANTSYNFYVRAICSTTDTSLWSVGTTGSTSYESLPPIVTNSTQYTSEELVNNVLVNNPCITISNVTSSTGTNFNSTNGIGYFTNTNPTFPISSGIILSTGDVTHAPGPNVSTLNDGDTSWLGDGELDNLISAATGTTMFSKNATKLEFDFTSLNEFMSFNFLFASEEYGQFQCTYSDAFAFLLTDLETGITTNLAVVPGTTTPISVVTIRDQAFNTGCTSVNPDFFGTYYEGNANYSSATNFTGQTLEMTASSAIIANHPYHIKLVVADRGDTLFDSAVFIKAGSFTSGPPQCSDKIELVAFLDDNNNGIQDVGEPIFNYGSFVTQQNNSGPTTNVSSPFGTYTVYDSNPSNTYDFSYELNSEYASYYSAGSVSYNDVNIALGSGTQTLYFPITLTNGFNDVTVSIIPLTPPRPGFSYTNKVIYKNLGVTTTSGTLSFNKDPQATITSISQAGTVANGTGFTYDFTNLAPYETRAFNVTMSVPSIPTVNLGDVLTNSASISALANDIDLSNNTFTNSQIVVASYDPNDKMEAHGDKIQFDQFSQGDYLYYTIRFQNNGTANAISVRIEDVLDAQLDETSIRMISASHNYIMERIDNHLVWKFDYINLPPALANEDLSKGYVFFKIKLKPGFTVGDIIPNTASIYFDENPAIVTNTFNTEFVAALNNIAFESGNLVLFPNPANNSVQISMQNTSESIKDVVIFDVLGKSVKKISAIDAKQTKIDVSNLSKGVYMVEIETTSSIKVIKKLVIN